MLAIEYQAAQCRWQIGARDTADAAVAEQHGFLGAVAHQGIVDTDGAELVDDDGGALPFRRGEKTLQQRGLAAAEESGDDRHWNLGAALALKPAPKQAGLAR